MGAESRLRFGRLCRPYALLLLLCTPVMAFAGAPRVKGVFVNAVGPRPEAGAATMLGFFGRKFWSLTGSRGNGAAPLVPFDAEAFGHNPSITWIGHATFLVRMDGVTFLTDPIFSEYASPVQFVGPKRFQPPGVPLEALPPIDFVVLSHDHYDHTDFASLEALAARGARFFAPLEMGPLIREAGGEAAELDWWQSARFGSVEIHCVPAQHFSGRSLTDQGTRLWGGFAVVGPTRKFYHAGDTGYFDGFAQIRERIGPVDLAAVPIGAYDPAEIMRFVHMNPEEAAQAVVDLGATNSVGMHYGTFDLTEEPLDEPPRRFQKAAADLGLGAERAWVMKIGETRPW